MTLKIKNSLPATRKLETGKPAIRPLAGYLLVEPSNSDTQTASGIVLPDSAQEKPAQGKVLSIGEDLFISGMQIKAPVKVGDIVIYKKWGGDEIKIEGIDYKLVRFDDLMAIIEEGKE